MPLKYPFSDWIVEIACGPITLTGDPLHEANENLFRFSLEPELASSITTVDLCDFLEAAIELQNDAVASGDFKNSAIMYIWRDEMSGLLCISAVTRNDEHALPFACKIDTSVRLEEIAKGFVESGYLFGIPFSELSSPVVDHQDPVDRLMPLQVFVVDLPREQSYPSQLGSS